MQNFWWNRKFYHGSDEPDGFRLHRLEEEQTAFTAAVESLTQAQTALNGLMDTYGTVLTEHSALLADLTAICEALRDEVQAVTVECAELGSGQMVLERIDEDLTVRLDALEQTAADTAAEQATKIESVEENLLKQSEAIAKVEEDLSLCAEQAGKVEDIALNVPGTLRFYGAPEGASALLKGSTYGSPMTHYAAAGTSALYYLSADTETTLSLTNGGNLLCGQAEELTVKDGILNSIDLSGMPTLKRLTISGVTVGGMDTSTLPHLTELHFFGCYPFSNVVADFSHQTALEKLSLQYMHVDVKLPEQPPELVALTVDGDYAEDEAFFNFILPDRSGRTAGTVFAPSALSYPVLAERNWTVEVGG